MPFEPSPSLSPLVPLCNRGRFAEGLLCATSGRPINIHDANRACCAARPSREKSLNRTDQAGTRGGPERHFAFR
jgi:hypothetical protein